MKRFADLFTRLDQTTKTNAKVDALARYFAEAPEQDRLWTIALLFFALACQKLWLMGQDVDRPFSAINPIESWF